MMIHRVADRYAATTDLVQSVTHAASIASAIESIQSASSRRV